MENFKNSKKETNKKYENKHIIIGIFFKSKIII